MTFKAMQITEIMIFCTDVPNTLCIALAFCNYSNGKAHSSSKTLYLHTVYSADNFDRNSTKYKQTLSNKICKTRKIFIYFKK